jgi:sarcosine oxidase/L-pipecolate oxidase
LLDYHPSYPSLFVAAGDSGHAFKFLPTLGGLIVAALDKTMPGNIAHLFTWQNLTSMKGDPSRGGVASFERKTLRPQSKL